MSTIFLAADSTVQSYPKEQYPQTGWGQVFYEFFKEKDSCKKYNRPDAEGTHVITYEMPSVSIENHAFAARSSRSFIEQGRLDEIMKVAKAGDYLMVQFAHNDAYEAREERYVPVERFGEWLEKYKIACDKADMTVIFVTPVSMRVFDSDGKCRIAFKEYRDEMIKTAKRLNVPCIDLSYLSTELFTKVGAVEARDIFLWLYPGEYPESTFRDGASDNAHFQEYGARLMASLVASAIRESDDERLAPIKSVLLPEVEVKKPKREYPEGFSWKEDEDMLNKAEDEIIKRE